MSQKTEKSAKLNFETREIHSAKLGIFQTQNHQKVDQEFLQHFMVPDCFESRTLPLNLSREDDCGGPIIRNSRG